MTDLRHVEEAYRKSELPRIEVGDHVSVGVLIRDTVGKQEKQRIQNFIGDVIAIGGRGIGRAFTVRRVVQGEGVERVFPLHSPLVREIKVLRKGVVRRAKLYHLRKKVGKAARVRERTGAMKGTGKKAARPAPAPAPEAAAPDETRPAAEPQPAAES